MRPHLAYTAYLLAHGEDADRLEKDAERFTRALQEHAWDEGAGYFGYVLHDEQGKGCRLFAGRFRREP